MSEEIFLEGKTYVSSKRAAEQTGYAQDYIGQLARKSLIDAQRVGGLWYVSVASLTGYQRNAAAFVPQAPAMRSQKELDSVVTFDGKDYVSASRTAKLTGYNQDYIGQLARGGKILSRQIGNRWYIDREMLLAHKTQKDALLAQVQTESVGLARSLGSLEGSQSALDALKDDQMLTYIQEGDRDLIPVLGRDSSDRSENPADTTAPAPTMSTPLTIRRISPLPPSPLSVGGIKASENGSKRFVRASGKTMRRAAQLALVLTFVVVLSYGWTGFKSGSVYTVNSSAAAQKLAPGVLAASAASAAEALIAAIENLIAPQLHYLRQ